MSPIAGQGNPGHDELHAQLRQAEQAIRYGNFDAMDEYNRLAKAHGPLDNGHSHSHWASDHRPLVEIAASAVYPVESLWYPPCE